VLILYWEEHLLLLICIWYLRILKFYRDCQNQMKVQIT